MEGLRRRLVAAATHCALCHRPLDHSAKPRTRWAPSADHILCVRLYPHLALRPEQRPGDACRDATHARRTRHVAATAATTVAHGTARHEDGHRRSHPPHLALNCHAGDPATQDRRAGGRGRSRGRARCRPRARPAALCCQRRPGWALVKRGMPTVTCGSAYWVILPITGGEVSRSCLNHLPPALGQLCVCPRAEGGPFAAFAVPVSLVPGQENAVCKKGSKCGWGRCTASSADAPGG